VCRGIVTSTFITMVSLSHLHFPHSFPLSLIQCYLQSLPEGFFSQTRTYRKLICLCAHHEITRDMELQLLSHLALTINWVIGELYVPVALSPVRNPRYTLNKQARRTPNLIGKFVIIYKSFVPAGNSNLYNVLLTDGNLCNISQGTHGSNLCQVAGVVSTRHYHSVSSLPTNHSTQLACVIKLYSSN